MSAIDFHAHILPGADHGSDGLGTSLAQLALIRAAGIDKVVATPHFYPDQDNPERFLRRRRRAAEKLITAWGEACPAVYLGAEVAVCPYLEKIGKETLAEFAVVGTNVLLLEMPLGEWRAASLNTVREIRDLGFTVVLAHIDRYSFKKAKPLLDEGFLVQLNASAFYQPFRRNRYIALANNGTAVALGSDLHGAEPGGYRQFARIASRLPEAEGIFARSRMLLQNAIPAQTTLK